MPLRVIANTKERDFHIALPIFFKLSIVTNQDLIKFKVRILAFSKIINPLKERKKRKRKKDRISDKKRFSIKRPNNSLQLILKMMGNFKIKRFYANLDTGDYPLNAQLLPIVSMLNNNKVFMEINFENRNEFDIKIVTQLYKIIVTGIAHSMRNRSN